MKSVMYICVSKGATFHCFLIKKRQTLKIYYSANVASAQGLTRKNNGAACNIKESYFAIYTVYVR